MAGVKERVALVTGGGSGKRLIGSMIVGEEVLGGDDSQTVKLTGTIDMHFSSDAVALAGVDVDRGTRNVRDLGGPGGGRVLGEGDRRREQRAAERNPRAVGCHRRRIAGHDQAVRLGLDLGERITGLASSHEHDIGPPEGSERRIAIRVEAKEEDGSVAVTVCDDGVGIEPDALDTHTFPPPPDGKPPGTMREVEIRVEERLIEEVGGDTALPEELP